MKTCKKCHEPKPLSCFFKHPATKDRLEGKCKQCKTDYARNRHKPVREVIMEKQNENQVEADIARFLNDLGWRRYRNQVGRFRTEGGARVMVGVVGWPDWTYRRTLRPGVVEILHVEVKSSTGSASPQQLETVAALNHIGEPATVAGSLHEFQAWYLARYSAAVAA